MKNDIKIIATVLITLAVMFATSFLLDLPIIQQNSIRKIVVYLLILFQFAVGLGIFIQLFKTK